MQYKIKEVLDDPTFKNVSNSEDFYFQKGQKALQQWLKLELNSKMQNDLLKLSTNYKKFIKDAETDSELKKIKDLLFEIISYCDIKANSKAEYNKYSDNRVLATASVRMNSWVKGLIEFKYKPTEITATSLLNALNYLLRPQSNCTILSENHRELISLNLFEKDYKPENFVDDLIQFFSTYGIRAYNESNYTHLLSMIIYSIRNVWDEKVIGLIASDGTGWQQNEVNPSSEFDGLILWNSKKPVGIHKTIAYLRELIDEEGFFPLFYSIKGTVKYKAEIIDFAIDQKEYAEKAWGNKRIKNYQTEFGNYKDEKKTARIVFLAKTFIEIAPISINRFKTFGKYSKPTQDNIVPISKAEGFIETGKDQHIISPLNQILYGPPGTGKTYHSIERAVEITSGKLFDNRVDNKTEFDRLRKEGQIEFVTFHQNYSYEDFIVGIAPDISSGALRFDKRDGIFKQLCERARQNWVKATNTNDQSIGFDEVFNSFFSKLIEEEVSEIEIPMRRNGYKFKITAIDVDNGRLKFTKQSGGTGHDLLIKNLKDIFEGNLDYGDQGLAVYYNPLVDQLKKYAETLEPIEKNESLKNYVIIIDEINRANISRVFGELITLLEDDKRLGAENELKVTLPNGEKDFGIPPNLYLIGTMNTADKSIALIDVALRRRFEFIGYYPKYEGYDNGAIQLLKAINSSIFEKKKSADYLIGHAYFMKNEPIEKVIKNKVIPLLMEYFSGKTDLVSSIFENSAWNVQYEEQNYSWLISEKKA